jgi:hypothetical protein
MLLMMHWLVLLESSISKQKEYKEVLYSLDLRRFGIILHHNQIAINWCTFSIKESASFK